jgi:diguanylate cyclase (GGDEF)-like protein
MPRLPRPRALLLLFRHRALARNLPALVLALLVGAAASALQLAGAASSPLSALDEAAHDLLLRSQPADTVLGSLGISHAADPRSFITIVAVDERTISELGSYNGGYPRSYHAQVVENLLAAPPRVIAFDFGFFEPTADDALLAAAFKHARSLPVPTSIILGAVGLTTPGQVTTRTPSGELVFDDSLMPVPILAEQSDFALANIVPDGRGTIRSMPLVASLQGVEQPTLGLAATAKYLRRSRYLDTPAGPTVEFAGRGIPLEGDAAVRINYFGPPSQPYAANGTFRVISFVDVLRGRIDPAVWRGGLVLVGTLGASGLADDYWTPISDQGRKMAGVEIHANVAATLFSTRFMREESPLVQVLITLSLAALMALFAANLGARGAWIAACLVGCVYLVANAWSLYAHGLLLPLTAPILAGLVSFSGASVRRIATEQRFTRTLRADAARAMLHDPLTGLPNRLWIRGKLSAAMRLDQGDTKPCALLLIHLERFREVNETLGRQAGDAALRHVGDRLREALPPAASLARHAGNEFAVLLPGLGAAAAAHMAKRVIDLLKSPAFLHTEDVTIGANVGVVSYPEHGEDPDTLMRRAELAMYAARRTRGSCAVYSATQEQEIAARLALVGALRRAVENKELVLYYQPKIECRSRRLVGVEALLRWQHPDFGLIGPDRFVALAEETGLIGTLTKWVVGTAVRQSRAWLDADLDIPVAVNLSALDFQETDLPALFSDLLARWDVPARMLSVEITEGALLTDPTHAQNVLKRLERIGVTAALDDFGTGYSSLGYLKQFPVHELKIDRSLVTDIMLEPRDRTIVRSTIDLGHSLGLVVVAEGVEDADTLTLLDTLGCDVAQGYFLGRPMSAAGLADWLNETSLAA